jgi:hypothetical protein
MVPWLFGTLLVLHRSVKKYLESGGTDGESTMNFCWTVRLLEDMVDRAEEPMGTALAVHEHIRHRTRARKPHTIRLLTFMIAAFCC